MKNSDVSSIPSWLQILIRLLAANMGLFCLTIWWGLPDDWSSFFNIPIPYARLAAVAVTLVIGSLAGLIWLRPTQPLLVKAHAMLAQVRRSWWSLALPIIPLVIAGVFFPAKWLVYALIGSGMLLAALILYLHDERVWSQPAHKWIAYLSVMLILAGMAVRIWFMHVGYFGDEGFYLSTAQNLVNGNGIAPAGMHMPEAAPHRPDWGRAVVVYGLWARAFGVTSLSLRYMGFLLGLIILFVIYRLVRQVYGHHAALITTGVVTASLLGNQVVSGRNSALPMLAFAIVLLTHLAARRQNQGWLHGLTGLLAALSLETHLLNLSLLAALSGVYAVDYLKESYQSKQILHRNPVWSFLAGSLAGLALYLYVHLFSLPAPEHYLAFIGRYGTSRTLLETILSPLTGLPAHYGEVWEYAWFELALMAISVAAALWRSRAEDRHWLLLLLFHEVAYAFVRPTYVINLSYTAFALPLLALGIGSLVVFGFEKRGDASPLWQRLSLIVICIAMIGSVIRATLQSAHYREVIDIQVSPIVTAINQHLPAGSVIVGHAYIQPYFLDYDMLYPASGDESQLAAAVIGRETDEYWLNIYLETLPRALLDMHFAPPRNTLGGDLLQESYFTSRHAVQVTNYVWIIPDEPLIMIDVPDSDSDPALAISAHQPLPDALAQGSALEIETLWTIREQVQVDAYAVISLKDRDNELVYRERFLVISSWQGEPTSKWSAFRFHDLRFVLDTAEIAPGQYSIWIDILPADEDLCGECVLKLGSIRLSD